MIHVGGSSYNNGIKFISTNYIVNFEFNPKFNSMKTYLRQNKENRESILSNIPLVRGLLSINRECKILFLYILFDILKNVLEVNKNVKFNNLLHLNVWLSVVMSLIICICLWYIFRKVFKNIKSTWQYHGAEHKVIFTNYQNIELNLENCKEAPRTSDNCGTMLLCLILFVLAIIKIIAIIFKISIWPCIYILIAYVVSYELFRLDRDTPVIKWIFKCGYWIQEHICTLEPSDSQLSQAIEAFKLLEMAEEGRIEKEEISNLLKQGKEIKLLNKLF